jgi:hypothetical protein
VNIKAKIENTFGEKSLDHALFYNHQAGLRFELSEGESYIEMFISAYQKAEKILQSAFEGSERIVICLAYYGEDTILENLSSLKGLEDCQITVNNPESWEKYDSEDESKRIFIAFTSNKKEIKKVLWGVLATELGITPQIGCTAYFIDFNNKIIASPYDDRGMDIIGSNKQRLQMLYTKHQNYLLNHDINEMKKHYK